jgi:hypothetical protein
LGRALGTSERNRVDQVEDHLGDEIDVTGILEIVGEDDIALALRIVGAEREGRRGAEGDRLGEGVGEVAGEG